MASKPAAQYVKEMLDTITFAVLLEGLVVFIILGVLSYEITLPIVSCVHTYFVVVYYVCSLHHWFASLIRVSEAED